MQQVVPMKEYDADPDGEGRPLRCCEEWFVSRLCQSSLGVGDPRALLDTTVMVRRRGGREERRRRGRAPNAIAL